MFYNLTDAQVAKIKSNFYPQERQKGEFLKSVIVNDYGTDSADNSIRIIYNFDDGALEDSTGSRIYKVFNNEQAKKYMKLKIFEILSADMFDDLKINNDVDKFNNIETLENIINTYGALSRDLSPSYDFIGDKTLPSLHIQQENNTINLVYDIKFLLARPKINYLSIGAIFYFDKEAYLSDQKVDEKFIDKRILLDKLYVYPLYVNNTLVDSAPVQDLRIIKSVFKTSSEFDNLINIINSNTVYNKILAVQQHKNEDLTKPNSSLENDQNAKDDIAKYNTAIAKKRYFSNVYYSRNSNKSLGFIFNLDYLTLIRENSAYKKIINRTFYQQEFIDRCKISSIKILRRKIEKKSLDKILVKKDSTISLIDSGETKANKLVAELDNPASNIKEISLKTGIKSYRTFAIIDKKVFFENKALYQYGVEIEVSDSISQYLNSLADELLNELPNLKNYLEETNKIVKITSTDVYGYSIDGSYDPLKNTFTSKFINNFNNIRIIKDINGNTIEKLPSYQEIVSEAAKKFVNTLLIIGLLEPTYQENFVNTITNTLNPVNSNADLIQYFINSYQRLINQINKIAKDNKNNTFNVQNWFLNDFVDSTEPINVGYKIINPDNFQGLATISTIALEKRINEELNKYADNPQVDSAIYENKKYCFLSPSAIYSKAKIVNLQNLAQDANAITNLDFSELEIDIKNNNYFGPSVADSTNIDNKTTNIENNKKNKLSIAGNVLANAFSIHTRNLFVAAVDNQTIKEEEKNIKNDNVNLTHLMLALSKQYDLTKNTYSRFIDNRTNVLDKKDVFANSNAASQNTLNNNLITNELIQNPATALTTTTETILIDDLKPEIPIHINFLLNNKCKLLKKDDNYKKSLDLNSKYQFLFNTLHSIEIMEYSSQNYSYDEIWELLTKEKLSSLQTNATYLCRLRNYRNFTYSIDGYDKIKLPVYEQYFLLSNLNISNIIPTIQQIKQLSDRDIINKFSNKKKIAKETVVLENPIIKTNINKTASVFKQSLRRERVKGNK
jgi:hypothetical protein